MAETKQDKADAKEAEEVAAAAGETIPGGKYLVNGVLVDANGEPLGKAKKE